jgi:acyl-CoA thioesterase-1
MRRDSFPGRGRRRFAGAAASLIGFGVAGPALLTPAWLRAEPGRTILVLGDSLSAEYGLRRGTGWVALLSERLREQKRPWQVVNASISGETTSGGRTRIADLLSRHRPGIVVIELGGNDALRGLDLALTERNLREMVQLSKGARAKPLLLGMMLPPNYGRAYAERFAGVYRKVADSEKAALVPFFLDGVGDRMDLFQADRIHPNEQAQPKMLDNVWPALSKLL